MPTDTPLTHMPRFAPPRVRSVQVLTAPAPRRPRGRRRTARGRRAVLAGVGLFLALQAGLNLAVRREWVPVRDPIWFEKLALLEQHPAFFPGRTDSPASPGTVRVMALGSSRTQLAFDAAALGSALSADGRPVEAFNFGCPAAGAVTCGLYARRLFDAGVKPDYLLVEIHPGFVAPADPVFEGRWLHPYRLKPDELDTLRGYGWAVEPPPHHGWKGWVASTAAFRFALLNRYAPVWLPCPYGLTLGTRTDARGFVSGVEMPRDRYPKALARTRQEYAPVLADYRVGGPGAEAVRDILAQCRANGVRAAVVLMPESSEHRSWYGPDGYRRITDFAQSLGVPVADAREWVADEGFADGHHLTASGAKRFTDRLAAEFVGPWVAGGHAP